MLYLIRENKKRFPWFDVVNVVVDLNVQASRGYRDDLVAMMHMGREFEIGPGFNLKIVGR